MQRPNTNGTNSQKQKFSALDEPLQTALTLLFRGYQYALDTHSDFWDFAVEIEELRRVGLTNNEFRWLLANGLVQCKKEVTLATHEKRSFRPVPKHSFPARASFVLTEAGANEVAGCGCANRENDTILPIDDDKCPVKEPSIPKIETNGHPRATNPDTKPHWDADRKELRIGDHLVKVFKWPSPNQETILAVFEEDGWPAKIDDPLPVVPEQDPKRRLHDTIKCLNRNQKMQLIRFRGDGTGEGVIWTFATGQDDVEEDS